MLIEETEENPSFLRWLRMLWGLTEKEMARKLRVPVFYYRLKEWQRKDGINYLNAVLLTERIKDEQEREQASLDIKKLFIGMKRDQEKG